MVMSFVLAVSLAMLALLKALAMLGAERAALEAELERRQRADRIALDCIYVAARSLAVLGDIGELKDRRFPVGEGFCTISDEDPGIIRQDEHLIFRGELDSVSATASNIHAEIAAEDGLIKLIKI